MKDMQYVHDPYFDYDSEPEVTDDEDETDYDAILKAYKEEI